MATDDRPALAASSFDWEDCTGSYQAGVSIAKGGGYWPSMISCDIDLGGSIVSDDARSLAAMLLSAADACDHSTREVLGLDDRPPFLGRLLCRIGWHGSRVPSVWHDEGDPLTECGRCGAVDV